MTETCEGDSFSYSYDGAGNLETLSRWDEDAEQVETVQYLYNGANQIRCVDADLSGECDGSETVWQYDAYGNLLDDGTQTYSYDAALRLASVSDGTSTTTYAYNGDGDRVGQTVDGVATSYVLDIATPLTMVLAETTGTETIAYLHGLDLIAQSNGTTTEYFAYDGLGSVRQLADAPGNVLLAQTYDPYGSVYASAGVDASSYGFTGERVDVNGLVYLRARYYGPRQGRFFQIDPSRLETNLYQYGLGNPVTHTDPMGLICVNGVDKWPYELAPCDEGYDFGVTGQVMGDFTDYILYEGGVWSLLHNAWMGLGGNFIERQYRFMNYETYYANVEGGDAAYAEDFFAQLEAVGRFEMVAIQVADIAGPISEMTLGPSLAVCSADDATSIVRQAQWLDALDDAGIMVEQYRLAAASSGVESAVMLSQGGLVPYSEAYDLARMAREFRIEHVIESGNVSVFEYLNPDGTYTYYRNRNLPLEMHAEQRIAQQLLTEGKDPTRVTRIYSELQPCVTPGIECRTFIANNFPSAQVSYSFPFETRGDTGYWKLLEAVQELLFGGP